jgi:PPM family protein phosphatase
VAYEPGDRFLLCTDGVVDGMFDEQLNRQLRSPTPPEAAMNPAARLVSYAVEHSGKDNTTALVVEAE